MKHDSGAGYEDSNNTRIPCSSISDLLHSVTSDLRQEESKGNLEFRHVMK